MDDASVAKDKAGRRSKAKSAAAGSVHSVKLKTRKALYRYFSFYFRLTRQYGVPLSLLISLTAFTINAVVLACFSAELGIKPLATALTAVSVLFDIIVVATTIRLLVREDNFLRNKFSVLALVDMYFGIPLDFASALMVLNYHMPSAFTGIPEDTTWAQNMVLWPFFTVMLVYGVGFGPYVAVGFAAQAVCTVALVTFQTFNLFAIGIGIGFALSGSHSDASQRGARALEAHTDGQRVEPADEALLHVCKSTSYLQDSSVDADGLSGHSAGDVPCDMESGDARLSPRTNAADGRCETSACESRDHDITARSRLNARLRAIWKPRWSTEPAPSRNKGVLEDAPRAPSPTDTAALGEQSA